MIGPAASVVLASSAQVKTGPGAVYGVVVTGGSDAASLILYDNTSGADPKIIGTIKAAATVSVAVSFPNGIVFGAGCYATITGTAPSITVVYA